MRRRSPVVLLLAPLGLATVAALAVFTGDDVAATAQAQPAGRDDVGAIYLRDCAVCHGAEGRGSNQGPSLVGVGRASVDYWVSTGRMPLVAAGRTVTPGRRVVPLPDIQKADADRRPERQKPAYPPAVVQGLVDYVVHLAGGVGPDIPELDLPSADIARGGELFRLQCAACHAWGGEGGALLHREAPSVLPATPTQAADAIRVGPSAMPAFGRAALTDRQLNDVVAYLEYLKDPRDRGGEPLWHLGPVSEGAVGWIVGLGALALLIRWIGERG